MQLLSKGLELRSDGKMSKHYWAKGRNPFYVGMEPRGSHRVRREHHLPQGICPQSFFLSFFQPEERRKRTRWWGGSRTVEGKESLC